MSLDRMQFDHVGLTVADLDVAVPWYEKNFDLTRVFAFHLEPFDFSGVVLLHKTGWRLELLSRGGAQPGLQAAHPIEAALTLGYSHFCVRVDDLQATYDRLIAGGASTRMEPQPAPEPDVLIAFVADPDGNLIELLARN